MQGDPVVFVTDEMIEEGEYALSACGRDMETGALVSVIFMAMLSSMEGGKVVFAMDDDGDEVARYQRQRLQ